MIQRIKNYLFYPRFHFSRFQFNLIAIFFITIGLFVGSYFTLKGISYIFAVEPSSVTKDTDTDFNQGTLTSTSIVGSGTNAVIQLSGDVGPDGTLYKRAITIDNTSGGDLTDYQVSLTLDTASLITAGKLQADCDDIRFRDSDDSTSLNFWFEGPCNNVSSKIWVKIPSISASSTKTVYIYYGSTSANNQSSLVNTFIREVDGNQPLIGSWSMDETSGSTVADTSGNSRHGTATGTMIVNGRFNNARSFNGNGDYVHFGSNPITGTSPFTLEAWINTTTVNKYSGAVSIGVSASGQSAYIGTVASAQVGTSYSIGGGFYGRNYGSGITTTGTWAHVVMTFSGGSSGTVQIYVNGEIKVTDTYTPNLGSTYIRVGRICSDTLYDFNGVVDEVRIYNKALTAVEISDLYNYYGYTTANYPGRVLVRKRSSPEPTTSVGSEVMVLVASGSWESSTDSNVIDLSWNGGWGNGTEDSTAFSATVANVGTNNTITFSMRVASTLEGLVSATYKTLGTASSGTTFTKTKADLDVLGLETGNNRYIQVKAEFSQNSGINPQLDSFTIYYLKDNTAPEVNASGLAMFRSNGGTSVSSNGWTNNSSPYFSWTAGSDSQSGIKGYCLYLGTDPNGDPATSKGLLGTSPVSTTGTTCQFIISGTSIDLATSSYKGTTWLSTSNNPYYLNIKVVDNAGNVYTGSSAQFQFRFDNTSPTNVAYISCASGSFSNVADMNFSWPISGSVAASDDNSGLLGWQYQINSTSGTWLGTTNESILGVGNYIPTNESSRTLTQAQDEDSIVSGNNIVYFRSVDAAGNFSSDSTIRTCNLSYGGTAPSFSGTDTVTVTPLISTTNSFALSWPAATATSGQSVAHYYYMVNTTPPSTLETLQGNASNYIDNSTSTSVSARALPNVNKGSNTVYVVAIDDASPPNYSPSNYITGTFTLNSTDPDNVGNLTASDSSIKSESKWLVTLSWTEPSYQGAGNLTYLIYRSTDGTSFSQVGSTSGLSYVDNPPSSQLYYYKVYTKDGANATSSGTNTVSITPTGKWTTAPSLESGPTVSDITTKKATITWSTSRASDSKVQYGTSSDSYGDVEPSNSSQVTSHSIQLTGLNPGTTYYYKVKWTDEDGNTGISEEKSFTTLPAPTIKDVATKNISLTSAIIQFTSKDANKVKIYYGTSTSFGGVKEVSTSTSETTYTVELSGLLDGTKYYYKINTFDSENAEYEGTILNFTTLPRPKISNVRIQQVKGTAQPTILVTWTTNTEVSSIITYYPQSNPSGARDEVNVALTKGEHQMIVRGLSPQTDYILVVKGRDKIGNEAVSDTQRFTTATDTRPPQIYQLHVEGAVISPTTTTTQDSTVQLIVSWNTDEPGTSQVEFGEGTGTTYSLKTQEDNNLTYNHLVIISGLTPSKVYHLRAISKDQAGNVGWSIDTVTITPKTTENALNLVITNLQEAFGFLRGLRK